MRRSLTLKKETLAELSAAELAAVAGAQQGIPTQTCPTIPLWYCISSDAAPGAGR